MKNPKFIVDFNYLDPGKLPMEIVERKGLGHPDTLADGLANYLSTNYSEYCMREFGIVLHHNLDKLYVGGGIINKDFNDQSMVQPINVVVNGRISDQFSNTKIDIPKILNKWIFEYLQKVLPNIDVKKEVKTTINCNQAAERGNLWYRPKNIKDLPEYEKLYANDTSVCVAHSPLTVAENLTYEIEQYFWDRKMGEPSFKFKDFGQDIKVMTVREGNTFNVTVCVPVLIGRIKNWEQYEDKIKFIEKKLRLFAKKILNPNFKVELNVNAGRSGYRKYTLPKGTCAEVGEEGIVGRGNNNKGIISIYRSHTMESPFGKNPKYHTGRVLSFLAQKIADAIYKETGAKNTVVFLTKNEQDLIPPYITQISLSKKIDEVKIKKITERILSTDYLSEIIAQKYIA